MSVDQDKVEQFVGQVVGDVGATVSSALAHLGHRLGLYRAMAGAGPLTPAELAARTGTRGRYVNEPRIPNCSPTSPAPDTAPSTSVARDRA